MKNSKQRDLILKIVNNSHNHPTAYEIYNEAKAEIPCISLGTVYRNLGILLNNGLIRKIKILDGKDRFDKIYNNHGHFVCGKCHKIYDINFDETTIPKKIDNHKIISSDIMYFGICKNCLKEEDL